MIHIMNAPNAADVEVEPSPVRRRSRLVRDHTAVERFGLRPGAMYRIAYVAGGVQARRVSRSLVVFEGARERRRWDGEPASCLDFVLPQGRVLSLTAVQLVDARPASVNERGQSVLIVQDHPRRRHRRHRRPAPV